MFSEDKYKTSIFALALKWLNFEHWGFYDLKQGSALYKIYRLNSNL
jgi:hypothetical protein